MKKRNSSVSSATKVKTEVISNFLKNLENNYNEQIKELNSSNKTLNEYDKSFLSERFCLKNEGLVRGSSSEFFNKITSNFEKEKEKEVSNDNKNFVLDFSNIYISRNMLYSIFSTIEITRCSSVLILKNVGLLDTIFKDETKSYSPTEIVGSLLKLLRLDILTVLDLSDNNIGNEFIHSLFIRGIAFTTNLKQLKLSNTGIYNMKVVYDILTTLGAFEIPYYLKSNKMDEFINTRIGNEFNNNENKTIINEIRNNSVSHSDDVFKASKINFSLKDMDISDNRWNTEPFKILENFPNIIPRMTNFKLLTTIQSEKIIYHLDRNNYINSIVDLLISSCSIRRNSNAKQKKIINLIKKKSSNWAFGYSSYKKEKSCSNYYIHLNFRGKEDEFIVVYFKGVNGSKYIEYCHEWLPKLLEQEYNNCDGVYTLYEIVFDKLNKNLKDMAINEGVTILILHICEYKMYIINLGDSTAMLKSSGYKIPLRLSRQHLTNNSTEQSRFLKRKISPEMYNECNSITRMIGYSKYSEILNSKPDILIRKIDYENDQYIIISNRDVWKVLTMDDVDSIYNEVIEEMKKETLESSNWPDVVAKRIVRLVKNKYMVTGEITVIVLILYKKDMPKCKKKIEDISNASSLTSKDKALSFQNIMGMIGLGKNDKSTEMNSQDSLEEFDNSGFSKSAHLNKSDFCLTKKSRDKKRMSLNGEYRSENINHKESSNSIIISPDLDRKQKNKSEKYSSFKNYRIPTYNENVSKEFFKEMESFLNSSSIELNTVNWFKNDINSKNNSRTLDVLISNEETNVKCNSNYELKNYDTEEEKNKSNLNNSRNIYSSNDILNIKSEESIKP